jgi:ubiquinone/menaquinone biosynthesis C-methylase UbiE
MPYVLMKVFEEAPRKFDAWMQLLTLGRLERLRQEIASSMVGGGARVLEIGCGPGTLAAMLCARGAEVVGIDSSPEMLEVARQKLGGNGHAARAEFRKLSALEIEDAFEESTFDCVIAVLLFSELTDDEIDCVLKQCRRVLKPHGRLIVVDEVEPTQAVRRGVFRVLRFPLRLVTFLVLQAKDLKTGSVLKKVLYYVIELPLMLLTFLVVPPASHPLSDLEERVRRAGIRPAGSKLSLAGTLKLLQAERTT